jgi:predicted acyltransferase
LNRLPSLDVFRGLTVAFMILVNNPGSGEFVYAPLRHADWHGWTPTDLVFPFFLWIVGLSMTLSFDRRIQQGADRRVLWSHALRRGALIFLIGFALNLLPKFDFEHVRIMGVLQRIGLCYILGATIYLSAGLRGQIAATVALLAGYWALMTFAPVPSYGPGVLGKEGNFAQFIDQKILGGHMWAVSKTWDPEGVLSTFPATANVLLGAIAGYLLRHRNLRDLAWFGLGVALAGQIWAIWFPINKPLWTSSYALFTSGLAALAYVGIRWLVDVKGIRRPFHAFEILGMNALVAFVGSGVVARILSTTGAHRWLWDHVYTAIASPVNASLLYALSLVLLFLLISRWMWSRKIFVKL